MREMAEYSSALVRLQRARAFEFWLDRILTVVVDWSIKTVVILALTAFVGTVLVEAGLL